MKNFLLTIPIALCIACANKEINKSVLLHGKIENPTSDILSVSNKTDEYSTPIDSSGYFELRFEIENADYFDLECGELALLYISPGDSIYFTLNTDQFDETLKFSGKGSAVNNYLIEKFLLDEKMDDNINYKELCLSGEETFRAKTDSFIAVLEDHLKQFALKNKEKTNDKFIKHEELKLKYYKAKRLTDFPRDYHNFSGTKINLSENYYNFLNDLNLNDTSLLTLKDYNNFLKSYIKSKIIDEISDSIAISYDNEFIAAQKIIIETFTDEKIKNKYLFENMLFQMNLRGIDNIEKMLTVFNNNCSNSEYLKKVEENYKSMQDLSAGNPAPAFAYSDINGNLISLADFKGKYVYIDVWSTTCGGCIKQIPHLKKLEEEFEDKNIIFLGVSLDNNDEKWENMVKDK
jgi:thiol-disulfide isomerase/thioredoxin